MSEPILFRDSLTGWTPPETCGNCMARVDDGNGRAHQCCHPKAVGSKWCAKHGQPEKAADTEPDLVQRVANLEEAIWSEHVARADREYDGFRCKCSVCERKETK